MKEANAQNVTCVIRGAILAGDGCCAGQNRRYRARGIGKIGGFRRFNT